MSIESGVVSSMYPKNLFVYCSYWGTWGRVLRYMNRNVDQVEVNLTPINAGFGDWKKEVGRIVIRKHGTSRDKKDVYQAYLPGEVVDFMKKFLQDDHLVSRLINEDFLSQIDWDKYRKHNNGGAPLDLIKKDS
jgi:hypothetical protein